MFLRKRSWITALVGVMLILLAGNAGIDWFARIFGTLGIILMPLGMFLINKDMDKSAKEEKINDINQKLEELNFSKEEIEERQPKLHSQTNKELKHVMAELQYRQKKMEEEEFYKPLEKKAF
ncbi:hypothetical protein GHK32_14200 [Staphylococcus aureus]|uniref:hypothetical protein n=1 Tax=Staphylococcus aureus TaxID=1280 RepID=UPI0015E623B6|nr:hypothetical protein [Staphylococcus aureus]MBA1384403.1 hypothetical protein [Staphylococcus aureus]MCQ9974090.1 hypothetical protein [Staphylococcus aureus]QPL29454.1 hypothetical protein I3K80_14130 [Staphylococcus aureus]